LNKKLGYDVRMTDYSYNFTARLLRRLGFKNFKQIEECINGYDDDKLSRILWGTRQGQISRFEYQLMAGMGENYINLHHWGQTQYWYDARMKELGKFREAGIKVGSYKPRG